MDKLDIRLFGSMQLLRGELSLTNFESNKVRALLAYLVVEAAHPQQRRKLASLFWPEIPETNALSNLRYALSNLRKVIGDRSAKPPYLFITPQIIQFNTHSHFRLDVADFEEFSKLSQENPLDFASFLNAAELYKGHFLEGFSIPDSVPFEEWVVVKRERFDQLAYRVFYKLADYYELIGDYDHAIAYAQRQIALDPWREEVYRLMMRCLYFSGQRTAAIAQFENCCKALSADLDIAPSPDTVKLYKAIREDTLLAPPSPPAFFLHSPRLPVERPNFVSRQEPLSRMHTTLNRALKGQGQLLLVSGGPGQGKTALVGEFIKQALDAYPHMAAAWGNSQAYFGFGDPFLPFREILEMLTGQVEHRWEAGAISQDHARRMWHLTVPSARALVQQGPELIGTFVPGISLLQRVSYILREEPTWLSRLSKLADQNLEKYPLAKEDLFQQYGRVLIEVSHRVPLLIFVDDLQWADQSSLGMFFHLSRQLSAAHILLLGAFRPVKTSLRLNSSSLSLADMVNELQILGGDILIDLDKLTDRSFIDDYLDQDPNQLGEDFREQLHQYTRSQPLYTVELLLEMKQRGDLVKNKAGEWEASASLNWNHLPPRIEAAIDERLSHLPLALLDMLKIASVEGERFTTEVLADVQGIDEKQALNRTRDELDHHFGLVQADSSRRVDSHRLTRYRFRHILFQKYLYGQLDAVERAEWHERVGMAIEERYAGSLEELSVSLAIHFELAGLLEKAIHYFDLAARHANRFSSYEDAINHYKNALSLLEGQSGTRERDKQEFDLLISMSAPLMLARGYASEDVRINNDRMAALLKRIPLEVEMFPIFHALGSYYQMRGQHNKALDLLRKGELLAKRSEDELLVRIVDWGFGFCFLWLGKLEEALLYLNRMFKFYDPQVHGELRQSYGTDAGVASAVWSAWALWLLGYPEQALNRGRQAIDLSNTIGDPGNQQLALDIVLCLHLLIGEMAEITELLHLYKALLEKSPLPIHYADYEFLQGFYRVQNGEFEAGINQMLCGIEGFQACGTRSQLSIRIAVLAEATISNSQWDQAAQAIEQAEDSIEETEERFYQAEVLRVKGTLMAKTGELKEAETCYLEAMQLAKKQKAKTLELRAAMSLAELWESQDRTEKAYQVLAEVYNWFTEGFDTADLIKARALLEGLGKHL